jgi:hypothetical protein
LLVQKPQNCPNVITSAGSTAITTTTTILAVVKKGVQDTALVAMEGIWISIAPGDITGVGHTQIPSQDHPAQHLDGRVDLHRHIGVAVHILPMAGSAQDHHIEANKMRERSEK